MKNNTSFAELVRHIQALKTCDNSQEELAFYDALLSAIKDSLESKIYQTIVPIEFTVCSLENAKEYARAIGMCIVEGQSGTNYLCWSKSLNS